jgi:hypothetical protein
MAKQRGQVLNGSARGRDPKDQKLLRRRLERQRGTGRGKINGFCRPTPPCWPCDGTRRPVECRPPRRFRASSSRQNPCPRRDLRRYRTITPWYCEPLNPSCDRVSYDRPVEIGQRVHQAAAFLAGLLSKRLPYNPIRKLLLNDNRFGSSRHTAFTRPSRSPGETILALSTSITTI